MDNRKQIQKLKDCAELAWASYGYFHYVNPEFKIDSDKDKKKFDVFTNIKKKELGKDLDKNFRPTPVDILNIEYKYYKDENDKPKDSWYNDKFLGGDFTPTQTKHFFERYTLLKHCPNTESGFSATLFQNKFTKEFIFAIRGTE